VSAEDGDDGVVSLDRSNQNGGKILFRTHFFREREGAKERVGCGPFTLCVFLYFCWLFVFISFKGFVGCLSGFVVSFFFIFLFFFPLSIRRTEGVQLWTLCEFDFELLPCPLGCQAAHTICFFLCGNLAAEAG
jgi:hypothetical protein